MIIDRLDNAAAYRGLGPRIAAALEYLRTTDFSKLPDGKQVIDGDRVYAMVQRYRPKPLGEAKWEAHRQYIDVQYLVSGVERMGYATFGDQLPVVHAYDSEKDYALYETWGDLFEVRPGFFVVFMPQDVHSPGLAVDLPRGATDVLKVVVKCRV